MEFLWKLVTATVWAWATYLLCDFSGLLDLRVALVVAFGAQCGVSFGLPMLAVRLKSDFLHPLLAPRWPNAPELPEGFWERFLQNSLDEALEHREVNPSTGYTMNGGTDTGGFARGQTYQDR